MGLEELRDKRARIRNNSDITIDNMQIIANESLRTADIAHNAESILSELDTEFEKATGLQGNDIKFLFTAIGLQVLRIVILNELTKIEPSGSKNRNETKLHEFQDKVLGKFQTNGEQADRLYYASMEHIISRPGVPFDATGSVTQKQIDNLKKKGLTWNIDVESMIPKKNEKISFAGANHRFSTLGHDPIIGLLIGTANIMTNTITNVKYPLTSVNDSFPVKDMLGTYHVIFTSDYKHPLIGPRGSGIIMLEKTVSRTIDEPKAFVAALIKQILHIGSDLYTTCGIQVPAANLILSKSKAEELTKHVSAGDLIKIGASERLATYINLIISTVHMLMYDPKSKYSRDVYSVRTKKIITNSNLIATGSNALWVAGNIGAGNFGAISQLDIGGLLVMLKRLRTDSEYIRQIKEEFVLGGFKKKIYGEDLELKEVTWD